ncbi:MAG: hypothetical protein JW993_18260 [Sedimentisphaerales bacterium]|nr:hypothetical protein [Sedimentisphaerales bacterium]
MTASRCGWTYCSTVAVVVALMWPIIGQGAEFAGGTGEWDSPYLIATAAQMNAIGADPNLWDKHFKLVADIDLRDYIGTQFNMIGHHATYGDSKPFTGVFDGNGRTISNFRYVNSNVNRVGLFGVVRRGEIRNLKLVDSNLVIEDGSQVGALVGFAEDATLTGCSVEGGRVSGGYEVGGLVGYGSGTTVLSCSSAVQVQGRSRVGGLTGRAYDGAFSLCHSNSVVTGHYSVGGLLGSSGDQIASCSSTGRVVGEEDVGGLIGSSGGDVSACYSTAAVTGTLTDAGGLVGTNGGTVTSCWASGDVQGRGCVGGLAGSNNGAVSHCYATGSVQSPSLAAGFAGRNKGRISLSYCTGALTGDTVAGFTTGGSVYLCYWDVETSGVTESPAARGRTTAQMQSASTYPGWGYGNLWVLEEGKDYPRLGWEGTPGRMLTDQPASYGGGTGRPDDPYQVRTPQQLLSIAYHREDFDKHFVLKSDIDLSRVDPDEILPIGTSGIPFTGSFVGDGHAISHFECRSGTQDYVGLFGFLDRTAYVAGIDFTDALVSGSRYVGVLAGCSLGTIERCSVLGGVTGDDSVGGLAGSSAGVIEHCSVLVTVAGGDGVGGLAGYSSGAVTACFSAGDVAGDSITGGLVGFNDGDIVASNSAAVVAADENVGGLAGVNGTPKLLATLAGPPPGAIPDPPETCISSCYCLGSVTGYNAVGGLVGRNGALIAASYAAAPVLGISTRVISGRGGSGITEEPATAGGLVGASNSGVTLLSYWDVERAGLSVSAEGRGKTTEQMIRAHTFRGWGWLGSWQIEDGQDYPHLAWEDGPGEPIEADPNRYSGGAGEPNDPYRIGSLNDLIDVGNHPADWDRCFLLTSDIDLAEVDPNDLHPIGVHGVPFSGVFDGNDHTISNFTCVADTENCVGLFGSIASEVSFWRDLPRLQDANGAVLNLHLDSVCVSAHHCAGGLAGYSGGTISGCSVTGRVAVVVNDAGGLAGCTVGPVLNCSASCDIEADRVAGGLIGWSMEPVTACWCEAHVNARSAYGGGLIGMSANTVESCHATGAVTGGSYVGGLIGAGVGDVLNCHAAGAVTGRSYAGGLIGSGGGNVLNCSSTGDVAGSRYVGGLVGWNPYGRSITGSLARTDVIGERQVGGLVGVNYGQIVNCYAAGSTQGVEEVAGLTGESTGILTSCYSACSVTGQQSVAGLVGSFRRGDIVSCFWDTSVSILEDGVAGLDPDPEGALGLGTGQMQKASTFKNAGWDFESMWTICEGQDYPRLRWEQRSCEE